MMDMIRFDLMDEDVLDLLQVRTGREERGREREGGRERARERERGRREGGREGGREFQLLSKMVFSDRMTDSEGLIFIVVWRIDGWGPCQYPSQLCMQELE